MSDSTPPVLSASPLPAASASVARWAAILSLLTPFVSFGLVILLFVVMRFHRGTSHMAIGLMGLLSVFVVIMGIGLGIVGLALPKPHERQGIFGKAIGGISLNMLFLVAVIVIPILVHLSLRQKYPVAPAARLQKAEQTLSAASTEEKRFYALDGAAKESFIAGDMETARNEATELLWLAAKYQNNWNYGNAIQDGHLVLGRIAVREGKMDEAKQQLIEAGNSPGSPQMDSFGPNMSLAKDLLEKGDQETPLQYFELCRKFWKMDYGKLDQWSKDVKAGKIPDFGANLVY